jgi:hypothetical protein
MSEESQPNRVWFWAAPSFAWFSTACSAPLIVHFFVVLFQCDAMKDGQYAIMFPYSAGLGFAAGAVSVALTVALSRRKPKFTAIAFQVALAYFAFWVIVVTACEAIVLRESVGFGVLMSLRFLLIALGMLPFVLLSAIFVPLRLIWLVFSFFIPFTSRHRMGGLKRLENRNSLDRETQLKLVTRTAKSS